MRICYRSHQRASAAKQLGSRAKDCEENLRVLGHASAIVWSARVLPFHGWWKFQQIWWVTLWGPEINKMTFLVSFPRRVYFVSFFFHLELRVGLWFSLYGIQPSCNFVAVILMAVSANTITKIPTVLISNIALWSGSKSTVSRLPMP